MSGPLSCNLAALHHTQRQKQSTQKQQLALLEGAALRVALASDILKVAAILGNKLCQLDGCFEHIRVLWSRWRRAYCAAQLSAPLASCGGLPSMLLRQGSAGHAVASRREQAAT